MLESIKLFTGRDYETEKRVIFHLKRERPRRRQRRLDTRSDWKKSRIPSIQVIRKSKYWTIVVETSKVIILPFDENIMYNHRGPAAAVNPRYDKKHRPRTTTNDWFLQNDNNNQPRNLISEIQTKENRIKNPRLNSEHGVSYVYFFFLLCCHL